MTAPTESANELLRSLAARYMWWCSPDEAVQSPSRVVSQVMTLGDYEDVQRLANELGDDYLRQVLTNARPGQFDPRSWVYWHLRLGLDPPPPPVRTFD